MEGLTSRLPITALVTGATDGIGATVAEMLLRWGARVIVHGRSPERVTPTVASLARLAADERAVDGVVADFGRLSAVRAVAVSLAERGDFIDVLINNAGIVANSPSLSADGFELTMAVNQLAPFALTHELIRRSPRLRRIVNVSSHLYVRGLIDLASFARVGEPYDARFAYASSKLANILSTVELAKLLRERSVTVCAVHPGVVSTKLLASGFGVQGRDSLEAAASNVVEVALGGSVKSGCYFEGRIVCPLEGAGADSSLASAVYDLSCRLTGTASLR
jgi:NAD(P)-dependent dehydrogenase (short-subunit alcohol dehydrogenase family)